MKKLKFVVCWLLVFVTLGTLCACSENAIGESKSVEDKVRDAVYTRATMAYYGSSIGGNELKSSRATITNVKQISDTEYRVSGKMIMTDVYGTQWSNYFDCKVTTSDGEKWRAKSFEYTGSNWSRN